MKFVILLYKIGNTIYNEIFLYLIEDSNRKYNDKLRFIM